MRKKWKNVKTGGWDNVEVDSTIWCCEDISLLVCNYGTGASNIPIETGHSTATCPKCGKVYRTVVRVTVQELIGE